MTQVEIPRQAVDQLAADLASLQKKIQAAQQVAEIAQAKQLAANATLPRIQVTRTAPVLAGAARSSSVEFTAKKGTELSVLDKAQGFYAVASAEGKTGWIADADAKPTTPIDTKLADWIHMTAANPLWIDILNQYKESLPATDGTNRSRAAVPVQGGSSSGNAIAGDLYKAMTKAAVDFRNSYKNNPYFRVSGFTVVLSIPPALNLDFSFK
ncbi:MAG TPA: SH3 domain-containing protein [Acetobacteraceae bacterium]|nr:SH3 domain-containing protein [Acetobacteraceae bacterium]